jgi:hypothetical protein
MRKRVGFILVIAFVSAVWVYPQLSPNQAQNLAQNQEATYRENNCVTCHEKIALPVTLSNRYFEWHSSAHKQAGVSCEKCHGGDPAAADKAKAHAGVYPYGNERSRIHFRNLPTTCGACHQGVVNTFVESKHFQNLKATGLGPSCSTCHAHMASDVILSPQQTSNLCAYCHDTVNGPLPPRPDIRDKAEAVMHALNRADVAVAWAASLLREAEMKRLYVPTERMQVAAAQGLLKDAKFTWHTFHLETTQKKADEAFQTAMKAKDELGKKVGH